ncbi:MAG: hypothetical protein R3C03_01310 [Pirellulaceae bacterium]
MKVHLTKTSLARWLVAITSLLILLFVVRSGILGGSSRALQAAESNANSEEIQSARGNLNALRELVRQHPEDWECKYWLAVDMIRPDSSAEELFNAGNILTSIPDDARPEWILEWKHRQLARLGISLIELQRIPWSTDPFQESIAIRLENAASHLRYLTHAQVLSDLTQLKQWLNERWAYVIEKESQTGSSIDAAFEKRCAEIKPLMLPHEAIQLLERFMADMSDGHSFLSNIAIARPGLPFRMRETENGVVIDTVIAESQPFRAGDLIVAINGIRIDDLILQQMEITACSTSAASRAWAIKDMSSRLVRNDGANKRSPESNRVNVEIERNGQQISLESSLVSENEWAAFDHSESSPAWLQSRLLSDEIGYIQVSTWARIGRTGIWTDNQFTQRS